jgi:hypothetical protein
MNAFRKIIETNDSHVSFELPGEFLGKKLEVIILPIPDSENEDDLLQKLFRNPIHLEEFDTWNRDEIYEKCFH